MNDSHGIEDGFGFPACPGKPKVPSDREVEALDALRAIGERARRLKREMTAFREKPASGREEAVLSAIREELSRLRVERESWEEKRRAAARERMILLGHEEGPV